MVKSGAKSARKERKAMLASVYRHSIDVKKRLFIPAKYREELGEKFFITRSLREKCLMVYSGSEWEKYVAPLENIPRKEQDEYIRRIETVGE